MGLRCQRSLNYAEFIGMLLGIFDSLWKGALAIMAEERGMNSGRRGKI